MPDLTTSSCGRPTRILLRSPKDPFEVVRPTTAFSRNLIAMNSGNLLFLQAVWKILGVDGVDMAPDRLQTNPRAADEINERYDAYVIPLANAFRLTFESNLVEMTQLIKRLRIPVVILGVGVQSNLKYELGRLKPIEPAVRAFVSAVLDHGPAIGVRGELTQSYLQGLGFRDVEIIGCPSMFMYGEDLRVEKRLPHLDTDARLSMSVTPTVRSMGGIVMDHVERYPNLTYVAQDLDTLGRLLWGESSKTRNVTDAVPIHLSHPLYRENHVRFYVEPWPWVSAMRTQDFAFGTRIHGNIAAIVAGTPAYVFAHDSRTLELARYFCIPHRPMPEVPAHIDAADLYEEADYGELNRGHAARFATFRAYLRLHGLTDAFVDGQAAKRFDERIARTPFPDAVDMKSGMANSRSLRANAIRARNSPPIRGARKAVLKKLARLTSR